MGALLKVLIGTACMVIIAGGGYFAWSEYTRTVAIAKLEVEMIKNAAEQIKSDANAGRAVLARPCKRHLDDLLSYDVFEKPNVQWSADFLSLRIRECLESGLLTYDDVEKVKHRL